MLALIALGASGHVAMRYVEGQPGPIRNAGSATGNGRGSVAGACGGGNLAFGANGVGTLNDGAQAVTLNINYAAGHRSQQNAFRFVYTCGDTSQNGVENSAQILTADANGCTATVSGNPAPYQGGTGVAAPDAIVPGGYSITCNLPLQNVQQSTPCTMSLLDQRDWGGCVDVNLLPANVAGPPAPPPPPPIPNTGSYPFSRLTMIDTSAATFNCCPLESGSIEIGPILPANAQSFSARVVNGRASNCRTNALIEAPETAVHELNENLVFTKVGTGNRYVATTLPGGSWAGQPFEISVENGKLDFQNVGAAQPIICDGYSASGLTASGPGGGFGSEADGGGGGATAVVVIIILIVLAGGGYYFYRKRKGEPMPPPEFTNPRGLAGAPPPPPPPSGNLPPGWVEMTDPNTGSRYYYNHNTGETTWHQPGGGGIA